MRKKILLMTLTLLVTGCGNSYAYCRETADLREELRAALLSDGGDQSVIAGATLLRVTEDYCLRW